jgi:hypothetical protein
MRVRSITTLTALLAIALAAPAARAAVLYHVVPLERPPGYTDAFVTDLNAEGVSAGQVNDDLSHKPRAALWRADGSLALPGIPPGATESVALGLDDAHNAVGQALIGGTYRAVRWDAAGVPTLLMTPDGATYSSAVAIHGGLVAGNVRFADGLTRVIRWDAAGNPTVLDLVPGAGAEASAIDLRNGRIAGFATPSSPELPIRYDAAGAGTILQHPDYDGGVARGINAAGVAAGSLRDADAPNVLLRAATWDASGAAHLPGLPAGTTESEINSIGDDGQSVGYARIGEDDYRGVLWLADGTPVLLDDLLAPGYAGWRTTLGLAISGNGARIVANAVAPGSNIERPVLLVVPEPSGAALLLLSIAGLVARRRHARAS